MTRAAIVLCALVASMAPAQPRYGVVRDGDIVRLTDRTAGMSVSVLVPVSNAYEVIVNGHNILRTPFASVEEFRARPGLNGIPLMAPFANRLDEQAFYANGKKYNFDMELGNVRGDAYAFDRFRNRIGDVPRNRAGGHSGRRQSERKHHERQPDDTTTGHLGREEDTCAEHAIASGLVCET